MGNLLHAKDLQYNIRLNYMGTGRLVSRREAGTTVEFRYNTEEDLVEIVNEHRHSYRFELDARGDVVREFGFNQLRRIYTRDSSGRIIRVERDSGLITWYTYDQLGRLCAVKYSDDSHEGYQYRPDGELIEASNDDCTVRFERDASGRIQREWQDDLWIESEYGENGLRHSVHSCFGAIQRIERSATGDVLGMRYLDLQRDPTRIVWETQIQRDSAGLELERSLPNGITSRWDRDELGRTTRHRVFGASTQNLDAEYIWDVNDRLKRIVDSQYGTTTFEHDDLGNLAAATYGDGRIELRLPDAIGNLFRTKDRTDRKYDRAGAILESRDEQGLTTYEHDAEGNLIRKCTPTGDWHYTWNAAGMLKSVGRPDGKKIEFAYDPLGRRIRKTAEGRTTRWIWDGNNPLHEWVECDEPANESSSEVAANHSPSGQTVPPDTTVGLLTDTDNALLPIPVGLITWRGAGILYRHRLPRNPS
jgi:YD repeat-containing protein